MSLRERLSDLWPILEDWFVSMLIGFLTVSHWRGIWTLFDIWTCDQPDVASLTAGTTFCFLADAGSDESYRDERLRSGVLTYFLGLGLTFLGVALMWKGLWVPEKTGNDTGDEDSGEGEKITPHRVVVRFVLLYILGLAAACSWRGIWYLTDHYLLPDNLTAGTYTYGLPVTLASYWVSVLAGAAGAFCLDAGGSLLAPPAIFLLDGPGVNPPPLAVTIVSSYYSLTLEATATPPEPSPIVLVLDSLISFVGLPIMVVWYWRGAWMLLDYYLWRFSPDERDLHLSLGYSTIIFCLCFLITCEATISRIEVGHKQSSEVLGRLRTFILALGAVNLWRVVWYIWDEFFGGTSLTSAWISHLVGIFGLLLMGCMACIAAPPATLGVDTVPHPKCADEPLFSMLPVVIDILYMFAIGRQPFEKEVPPRPEPEAEQVPGQVPGGGEVELVSTRPGIIRATSMRYFEFQRPGLDVRVCSTTESVRPALRPGLTSRSRSKYFRNR